jgi:hypothetical protein
MAHLAKGKGEGTSTAAKDVGRGHTTRPTWEKTSWVAGVSWTGRKGTLTGNFGPVNGLFSRVKVCSLPFFVFHFKFLFYSNFNSNLQYIF